MTSRSSFFLTLLMAVILVTSGFLGDCRASGACTGFRLYASQVDSMGVESGKVQMWPNDESTYPALMVSGIDRLYAEIDYNGTMLYPPYLEVQVFLGYFMADAERIVLTLKSSGATGSTFSGFMLLQKNLPEPYNNSLDYDYDWTNNLVVSIYPMIPDPDPSCMFTNAPLRLPLFLPLPIVLPSAVTSMSGVSGVENYKVHWGDVVVRGSMEAPARYIEKFQMAQYDGNSWSGNTYTDRLTDFYVGHSSDGSAPNDGSIVGIPAEGAPGFVNQPFKECLDAGNYLTNISYEKITSMLEVLGYTWLKDIAKLRNAYWFAASDTTIFNPYTGVVANIQTVLDNPPNAYYKGDFIFIDTYGTSSNGQWSEPQMPTGNSTVNVDAAYIQARADASLANLPSFSLSGDYHTTGIIYVAGSLTLGGGGIGKTIYYAEAPPLEDTAYDYIKATDNPLTDENLLPIEPKPTSPTGEFSLANMQLNGAVYCVGQLGASGTPRVYGALSAERGYTGYGRAEVWYNYRLGQLDSLFNRLTLLTRATTIVKGGTTTVSLSDYQGAVTWEIEDSGVATFTDSGFYWGTVTGISPGTTRLKVTTTENWSAQITITVVNDCSGFDLTTATLNIQVGETSPLALEKAGEVFVGGDFWWTSADPLVSLTAPAIPGGAQLAMVTGLDCGTTVISALDNSYPISCSGSPFTARVNVTSDLRITGTTLAPSSKVVYVDLAGGDAASTIITATTPQGDPITPAPTITYPYLGDANKAKVEFAQVGTYQIEASVRGAPNCATQSSTVSINCDVVMPKVAINSPVPGSVFFTSAATAIGQTSATNVLEFMAAPSNGGAAGIGQVGFYYKNNTTGVTSATTFDTTSEYCGFGGNDCSAPANLADVSTWTPGEYTFSAFAKANPNSCGADYISQPVTSYVTIKACDTAYTDDFTTMNPTYWPTSQGGTNPLTVVADSGAMLFTLTKNSSNTAPATAWVPLHATSSTTLAAAQGFVASIDLLDFTVDGGLAPTVERTGLKFTHGFGHYLMVLGTGGTTATPPTVRSDSGTLFTSPTSTVITSIKLEYLPTSSELRIYLNNEATPFYIAPVVSWGENLRIGPYSEEPIIGGAAKTITATYDNFALICLNPLPNDGAGALNAYGPRFRYSELGTTVNMSEDGAPIGWIPQPLTVYDADTPASGIVWSLLQQPEHGVAAVSGTGVSPEIFTYFPAANYNGSDFIYVKVTDGTSSSFLCIYVEVAPVNDAPVIAQGEAVSVSIYEDHSAWVGLSASDVDNLASDLVWSVSTTPLHGAAEVSGAGVSPSIFVYSPDPDFNGSDSFVVRVTDGALSAYVTVNVSVAATADAPVISLGEYLDISMSEDGVPIAWAPPALSASDADTPSSALTWSLLTPPAYGTAAVSGSGATPSLFSYHPNASFTGTDSFEVEVSDGALTTTLLVNVTVIENSTTTLTPGQNFTDPDTGMEFVWVAPGTFTMGADGGYPALPKHSVTLTRGYWIGKYEVSQAQWKLISGGSNPSVFGGLDQNPVENVNWNEAISWVTKLSYRTGRNFVLPTEAQWEFAARGGNSGVPHDYLYAGSDDIDLVGWFRVFNESVHNPVGGKLPNELGVYDMTGNVREWVRDWYSYDDTTVTDPVGPATGDYKIIRGGFTWDELEFLTVTARMYSIPFGTGGEETGFRLALTDDPVVHAPFIEQGDSIGVRILPAGNPDYYTPLTLSAVYPEAEIGALTWSLLSAPSHGTAVVSGSGARPEVLTFTPTPGYYGPDSFVVQVSDGELFDTVRIDLTIKGYPIITSLPVASSIVYGQTLASSTLTGGSASVPGTFAFFYKTSRPNAGTALQLVRFTPLDGIYYDTVDAQVSVTVNKATPSISVWPTASPITCRQTLGSSTLTGGSASVPGTFAFEFPTHTLGVGTASQVVRFTPTDTANYITWIGTVSVTVNKATPVISYWPSAIQISYGNTLASATLYGGSSPEYGTFSYVNPTIIPDVGTALQQVRFTPTYPNSLNTVDGLVSVTVVKAYPTILSLPVGLPINYGQKLSDSTLTGGVAAVEGNFSFLDPTAIPNVGNAGQTVVFTPTDTIHYLPKNVSVPITVYKLTPTVTAWPTSSPIEWGLYFWDSALTGGTASVAGSFAFENGGLANVLGTSSYPVLFVPASTNYNTVSGSVSVTVIKQVPKVQNWPYASNITLGQPVASSILSGGSAVVDGGLWTLYQPCPGTFSFVNPTSVPKAGWAFPYVIFTPQNNTYYDTVIGSVSFFVEKPKPTVSVWPTASSITYGQTLASSTLTGGSASVAGTFAFATPTTVPNAGTSSQSVRFTPTDTSYYGTVDSTVSVNVTMATPTVSTWPIASSIISGQTLTSSILTGGSASVAGTFAFTAPSTVPAKGTSSQSVRFTPTNTANYNTVSGSVNVSVTDSNPTPTISAWPTTSSINYGQTLASVTLTGGSASVPGTFAFVTPTTVPNAGISSQPVRFTPTNSAYYSTVNSTLTVNVHMATPTVLVWPSASAIAYGQTLASSTLSGGSASVVGTFSFIASATAPEIGTATPYVRFTPAASSNYNGVTGTVSVNVTKATPNITAWPTAISIIQGQTLALSTLSGGVASVAGSFAFSSPSTVPSAGTASYPVKFTPADIAHFMTVTGSAQVTVSAVVADPTLSLNLPLDGIAIDLTGNSRIVGTTNATPASDRKGVADKALSLSPTAYPGSNIKIDDSALLDTDTAFTLSGWFKVSAYGATQNSTLFAKWVGATTRGDYLLTLNTNGTLTFNVGNAESGAMVRDNVTSTATLPPGAWTHVAATFDNGVMALYLNGVKVAGKTSTKVVRTDPGEYANDDLYIGSLFNNTFRFNGSVDEVCVFNRSLTEAQVRGLYDVLPAPLINLPGGFYMGEWTVTLTGPTPWMPIRYTLDGVTTPSATVGTLYTGPITLSADAVLQAVCVRYDLFEVSPTATAAYTAAYGPTDSLALYMPMDGNANDVSGNGNNGVSTNASLVADRDAMPGRAYSFDPTIAGGSKIKVPDSASLDTDSAFTLSSWIWVNAYGTTQNSTLFSKWESSTTRGDYFLRLNVDGSLTLSVANAESGVLVKDSVTMDNYYPIRTGAWSHVAATFDHGVMTLYLNGVKRTSKTSTTVLKTDPGEYANDDLYLGSLYANTFRFNGVMDDARVYSRALTAEEIKSLTVVVSLPNFDPPSGSFIGERSVSLIPPTTATSMRYTLDGSDPTPTTGFVYDGTPISVTTDATVRVIGYRSEASYSEVVTGIYHIVPGPSEGLVLHLGMDGNALDSSGNANNGVAELMTSTADRFSNPNSAYQMTPGQSWARIKVPDSPSLDTDSAFTLTGWFKLSAYGTTPSVLLAKWASTASKGDYLLWVNANGTISLNVASSQTGTVVTDKLTTTATMPLDTWTHVAATFNNGSMSIHINGVKCAAKVSTLVTATEPGEYPNDEVYLGANYAHSYRLKGVIDDARIYNRALAEGEITTVATYAPLSEGGLARMALARSVATAGPDQTPTNSAETNPEPAPGERWTDTATGITFAYMPAATFLMGSDKVIPDCDASPAHLVSLSTGYWLAQTEVTQGQWESVMGLNPSSNPACPTCPVENVTLEEINTYLTRLTAKSGLTYQLPTEAQWEYAARSGGQAIMWAGTNNEAEPINFGWLAPNATFTTHAVGTKLANGLGLNDLNGNVAEWTRDNYLPYSAAPVVDPVSITATEPAVNVLRGGSYLDDTATANTFCREAIPASERSPAAGFRVVVGR